MQKPFVLIIQCRLWLYKLVKQKEADLPLMGFNQIRLVFKIFQKHTKTLQYRDILIDDPLYGLFLLEKLIWPPYIWKLNLQVNALNELNIVEYIIVW